MDLERARKFYEATLGLKVEKTDPSPEVLYQCGGGTKLYVYQRGATKADHTAAAFALADVEALIGEPKAAGVIFHEIDMPGIQTVPGKGWFTILRLYSPLEPSFDKSSRVGEIEKVE